VLKAKRIDDRKMKEAMEEAGQQDFGAPLPGL
jgi:hypothetical protein